MKILSTLYEPCPVAQPTDPPCTIEVESESIQRPNVHLGAGGQVRVVGHRGVSRENVRYCTTHKHVHHIPEKENWR